MPGADFSARHFFRPLGRRRGEFPFSHQDATMTPGPWAIRKKSRRVPLPRSLKSAFEGFVPLRVRWRSSSGGPVRHEFAVSHVGPPPFMALRGPVRSRDGCGFCTLPQRQMLPFHSPDDLLAPVRFHGFLVSSARAGTMIRSRGVQYPHLHRACRRGTPPCGACQLFFLSLSETPPPRSCRPSCRLRQSPACCTSGTGLPPRRGAPVQAPQCASPPHPYLAPGQAEVVRA